MDMLIGELARRTSVSVSRVRFYEAPSAIVAALLQKDAEIDRLIEAATARKKAIAALLDELHCAA